MLTRLELCQPTHNDRFRQIFETKYGIISCSDSTREV